MVVLKWKLYFPLGSTCIFTAVLLQNDLEDRPMSTACFIVFV